MEIKDVRLQNLLELAKRYERTADFCTAIGISPSYFSQVKGGGKEIGNVLARRTETALALPKGWMDTNHGAEAEGAGLPSSSMGLVYALESLPNGLKRRLSSLIYELAAECATTREELVQRPGADTPQLTRSYPGVPDFGSDPDSEAPSSALIRRS